MYNGHTLPREKKGKGGLLGGGRINEVRVTVFIFLFLVISSQKFCTYVRLKKEKKKKKKKSHQKTRNQAVFKK